MFIVTLCTPTKWGTDSSTRIMRDSSVVAVDHGSGNFEIVKNIFEDLTGRKIKKSTLMKKIGEYLDTSKIGR